MKKLGLWLIAISFTGCASLSPKPEELKADTACKVWTKDVIGMTKVADINEKEEMSRHPMMCWVFNMYLCSYNKYTFDKPGGSELKHNSLGKVGTLEGNKFSYKMTGVESDPMVIKDGKVDYYVQGPVGSKRLKSVEYNKSCNTREVALGILALAAI